MYVMKLFVNLLLNAYLH